MSPKQQFIEMMQNEPEDISVEELAYQARLCSSILVGLKQAEEGNGIPHEEVMEIMRARINRKRDHTFENIKLQIANILIELNQPIRIALDKEEFIEQVDKVVKSIENKTNAVKNELEKL